MSRYYQEKSRKNNKINVLLAFWSQFLWFLEDESVGWATQRHVYMKQYSSLEGQGVPVHKSIHCTLKYIKLTKLFCELSLVWRFTANEHPETVHSRSRGEPWQCLWWLGQCGSPKGTFRESTQHPGQMDPGYRWLEYLVQLFIVHLSRCWRNRLRAEICRHTKVPMFKVA